MIPDNASCSACGQRPATHEVPERRLVLCELCYVEPEQNFENAAVEGDSPSHTHDPDQMMFHPDCPACEADKAAGDPAP